MSNSFNTIFWDNYIKNKVIFNNERSYTHYYNEIPYTRWPVYIGCVLFTTILICISIF